jgi:hypothetical protein
MKQLILFLIAAFTLSSCVTQRACDRKFPPQQTTTIIRDSIVIYRDTTIYITLPREVVTLTDTVVVYIREGFPESDRSELHGTFAWTWAQVKKGRLLHELHQNDTTIARTIERAIRDARVTETIEKVVVREVNYVTGWQWFQIWAGRLLMFALLIIIFLFLLDKRLRFL